MEIIESLEHFQFRILPDERMVIPFHMKDIRFDSPNRTCVGEDEVGELRLGGGEVSLVNEDGSDDLTVIDIHLTAIGFNVEV